MQLGAEHYSDPLSFRPERFLEGDGAGYSWIAFGGGTRRCLGAAFAALHMRVVLRTILQRAELRPDRPADEAIRNDHITLVARRGPRVVMSGARAASRRAATSAAGTVDASPHPTRGR